MREKKVTVREIARESGVSIATVSRFLNRDYAAMSDATRQKLQEIVERTSYVNNKEKAQTIAVLFPSIADPYCASLLEQLAGEIARYGCAVQMWLIPAAADTEEKAIRRIIAAQSVSGLVYYGGEGRGEESFALLREAGLPFVVLDHYLREHNVPAHVFANGGYGMYDATKHLIGHGHRRIAYFSATRRAMFEHYCYHGYVMALLDGGLTADPALVLDCGAGMEGGRQGFETLWRTDTAFTAIVCENDLLAAGAYQAAEELGLRIPEDMSVVGFNNSCLAAVLHPGLTSVDQKPALLAERAVELLMQQLRHEAPSDRVVEIKPALVCRDSVRQLPVGEENGCSSL